MTTTHKHRQLHKQADDLLWKIQCQCAIINGIRKTQSQRTGMNPETVARLEATEQRRIVIAKERIAELRVQYAKIVGQITESVFRIETIAPTLERYY